MGSQWRVSGGHREWLVTVNGGSAAIDGVEGEFLITARADGRWSIARAGRTAVATSAQPSQSLWTGLNGAASEWRVEPASAGVRHTAVDHNVRAPMSATVLRVPVHAGDEVAEGDLLVVVEAMKMEMPLRAPRAGVIKSVLCQEGDLVQSADVLVELE